jgi:hypothetical protein
MIPPEATARQEILDWDGIEQAAGGSTKMPWEEQRARLIHRVALVLLAERRTTRAAAAQIATDMVFGYSPATSHATTCGMIATAILAMEIGEGAG